MYGCAKAAYSKAFTRVMTNNVDMTDDVDFWVPLLEKGTVLYILLYILQHIVLHNPVDH